MYSLKSDLKFIYFLNKIKFPLSFIFIEKETNKIDLDKINNIKFKKNERER